MGQASRRGTYEQRKERSIEKKKEKVKAILNELETPDKELSQDKTRYAIMAMANLAKKFGMSVKEYKRGLKRHNKKHI